MPFITQGKTNRKFILIVVVLAAIVGGGALWCSLRKEQVEVSFSQNPSSGCLKDGDCGEGKICLKGACLVDETANWQTYRNKEYGFEISYPNNWDYSVRPDDLFSFSGNGATFLIFINWFDSLALPPLPSPPQCESEEFFSFLGKNGFEKKIISTFQEGVSENECDKFLLDEHLVYGQFCIDEELRVYFPRVKETVFGYVLSCDGGNLYDVMLSCQGENWQGEEGRNECNSLFNQVLSTSKFLDRENIIWEEYKWSEREKLAKENKLLYDTLIQGDGPIEKNCQIILKCEGESCSNLSESINISYFDLTNDGKDEAIVVFKGGMMFRGDVVGVFWPKEGKYLKILDEGLYEEDPYPELEDNRLVIIEAIYLPGDARCCPSSKAHVYYKFTGEKLEVDKVIDDYGYDITDTDY